MLRRLTVEVARLAPDLIRIGCFPAGRPPDYRSDALAREFAASAPLEVPAGMRFEAGPEEPGALFGPALKAVLARRPGERFFGCGERTAGLEKTGSHQIFWNYDPPEGHTASFNNL